MNLRSLLLTTSHEWPLTIVSKGEVLSSHLIHMVPWVLLEWVVALLLEELLLIVHVLGWLLFVTSLVLAAGLAPILARLGRPQSLASACNIHGVDRWNQNSLFLLTIVGCSTLSLNEIRGLKDTYFVRMLPRLLALADLPAALRSSQLSTANEIWIDIGVTLIGHVF